MGYWPKWIEDKFLSISFRFGWTGFDVERNKRKDHALLDQRFDKARNESTQGTDWDMVRKEIKGGDDNG